MFAGNKYLSYVCHVFKKTDMKFQAKRNINIKSSGRIVRGEEVTILKAISTTSVKLVKIITKDFSFRTTQGIADSYFTLID